jgi:hypothetical protein
LSPAGPELQYWNVGQPQSAGQLLQFSPVPQVPSPQEAPQAPPAQDPPEQASLHVAASPSSQEAVLLVWVQKLLTQLSSVQELLSSQGPPAGIISGDLSQALLQLSTP